jgi:predicted lipoprotein with Yx(FWY)xxD motif
MNVNNDHLEDQMKSFSIRGRRTAIGATAALAGFATAALVSAAVAATFTLHVAKNAKVINANTGAVSHENIAVTSHSKAVYLLSGDSKTNPKCTKKNGCFVIWPPLTVPSGTKPTKASGIKGKLSIWHRNGFNQVVLGGHPVYRYAPDRQKNVATGEAIHTFGGTWHVFKTDPTSSGMTMSTGTGTSTMTTTTTMPCLYPPYC